jgi:hypothetical protein
MKIFQNINYYNTVINDESLNNIYVFSDIHADIHALIIALRDCAKVIKKRSNFIPTEKLLNIDIVDNDNGYIHNLMYEWCGENSQVVIIGDFIDGRRYNNLIKDPLKNIFYDGGPYDRYVIIPEHEYYQIELKIFLFINSINRQAQLRGGKIHKLLGNHEVGHILNTDLLSKFMYDTVDIDGMDNYYRGISRKEIFYKGNPGYNMIFEGGCGLLLCINNNIFVHGSLQAVNIEEYIHINNILNNPNNPKYIINGTLKSPLVVRTLNNRHYGSPIDYTGTDQYILDKITNCRRIDNDIRTLFPDNINVDKMRVIVGHCIQMKSMNKDRTFQIKEDIPIYEDSVSIIYGNKIVRVLNTIDNHNLINGITLDCIHKITDNDGNLYNNIKLIKVDIGVSRGQDDINDNTLINYSLRTPQVFNIQTFNGRDHFYLIKSKLKNTRIFQTRHYFDNNRYRYHDEFDDYILDDPTNNIVPPDLETLEETDKYNNKSIIHRKILSQYKISNPLNPINIPHDKYVNDRDNLWTKKYLKYKKKYLRYKKKYLNLY